MVVECHRCGTIPLNGGYVAAFSPGVDGLLYVLVCMGEQGQNWIEWTEPNDWRVLAFHPDGWHSEHLVPAQKASFDLIQPMPNGFLLATRRCQFAGDATSPNGHVFDFDGRLVRSALLGDGIEQLQTSKSGGIWVSYFDEGIFGNLGWTQPIGHAGLLRFDAEGNVCFRFQPVAGLDQIDDCYCLNVVSEREVWCYYYTQFSIVRICDERVVQHWKCPVAGSSKLAVWRDSVLMQGGYKSDDWKILRLTGGEAVITEGAIAFVTPDGQILPVRSSTTRGDAVWFVVGDGIYRTEMKSDLSLL